MPSNQTYAFADTAAATRSVHVVRPEDLAAFLGGTGAAWSGWLTATGFEAGLGELRLLPGADGGVAGAVVGYGTAQARRRLRFGLARAVAGLPAGHWRLEGDLSLAERTEAALAWLLAGYRFDRYRLGRKPATLPRLACPEGLDAARLIAMAEAEALTRDLINTPAEDMGPEELEAAFLSLAAEFGADPQRLYLMGHSAGAHIAAMLSLSLSAAAQEGHPLKGSWIGEWKGNAKLGDFVLLVLDWDGKAITGVINPGTDNLQSTNGTLNSAHWTVNLEPGG